MENPVKLEFVNAIVEVRQPKTITGLTASIIIEALNLQSNASECSGNIEKILDKVRDTEWQLNLKGIGKFKVFFLKLHQNNNIEIEKIRIMGIPLEGIQKIMELLDHFTKSMQIEAEVALEISQARISSIIPYFDNLFEKLIEQGKLLNKVDKGNTVSLDCNIEKTKARKLLLQKTNEGGKVYLILDEELTDPLVKQILHREEHESFLKQIMEEAVESALQKLQGEGFALPVELRRNLILP